MDESNKIYQIVKNQKDYKDNLLFGIVVGLIILLIFVPIIANFIGSYMIYEPSDVENINNTIGNISETNDIQNVTATATKVNKFKDMRIYNGLISTGNTLTDYTYCTVYVDPSYAGENIQISVTYSRNGNALNNGNYIVKNIASDGSISVRSSNAFSQYPDYCVIKISDLDNNELITYKVKLTPTNGNQTF